MIKSLLAAASDIIGTSSLPSGYVNPSSAAARIASFLDVLLIGAAILSTFFIIKGGIDYIMSGGDPGKIKTAMFTIQYAVMGLVVAGVAFVIVRMVANLIGITDLNLPI